MLGWVGWGAIKLYLREKGQSGYNTVFKNIASVFYTHCFTALTQKTTKGQLDAIILDLGLENSFVKLITLHRSETLALQ